MTENESTEAIRSCEFYFDDFEIGRTLQMGTYAITGGEILASTLQYDPQPFHIDVEATKHSIYGGIISSGQMTRSIMMRLVVIGFPDKVVSMDSLGVDEIRRMKPVYPRDTLSVPSTRMGVRPLQPKLDRDVAVNHWEICNRRGELICTVTGMGLFGRHPKA